jgi:hypothetical protein
MNKMNKWKVDRINRTLQCEGFYLSYNYRDSDIYGSDMTALVLENMSKFFILNGDHRKAYEKRIDNGFAACLEYFKKKPELVNKLSEKNRMRKDFTFFPYSRRVVFNPSV